MPTMLNAEDPLRQSTILVVDDDPISMKLLTTYLQRSGFQALVAANGTQALDIVRHVAPDLILLDVRMPDLSGFDVCRILKAEHTSRDIPVVFMTALNDADSVLTAFQAGGIDYIAKPFQYAEVFARVTTHIRLRTLTNSLMLQNQQLQQAETALRTTNQALEREVQSRIHELEERKRLEAQLVRSQKMEVVGQLAGGIVHDFNNLLTIITGYASLVQATLDAGTPIHADLQSILDASTRGQEVTRQLLVFSRQQSIRTRIVNPNILVAQMSQLLNRLLDPNICCRTLLSTDIGFVNIDPTQIEQTLLNLVLNARDAMPYGGTLTLETAFNCIEPATLAEHHGVPPGNYTTIAVRDTGIGMSAETLAHVFEPFFTTKPEGKGTGLGLTTCYSIMRKHAGYITVESQEGVGTTFVLYLPVVVASVLPETAIPVVWTTPHYIPIDHS